MGQPTIRNLRWYIAAMLLAAAVINYIDRQVFSILAPDLQAVWSNMTLTPLERPPT